MKDVPPLRECGRGTDGGTVVEGPARGSWNNRAPNAAINPSNSVMPSGRHRDGRVQEEVVPQGPVASRQEEPGNVKHLPHLRGRQREPGMDSDKRRPQAPRGSGDHRNLNAASNPSNLSCPQADAAMGKVRRRLSQGPVASRQGHPGSVPKREDRPHLRGHGREHGMDSDKRRPQAPSVEAGITGT